MKASFVINSLLEFKALLVLFIFICLAGRSTSQTYVTPEVVTELSDLIKETSGLANLNGEIWTHNDKGDESVIYQLDPANGNILRIVEIMNAANEDWEDITHDENYVYIGDIGNNDGDRTDLRIYKVSKAAIAASDEVYAEIIEYSYSDQTAWEPNHNNHDFDCEALISFENNLYLFSKNWIDNQTRCYQLPKQAGTHIAEYQSTFDINCLVTGAEILLPDNRLVFIGYNTSGGCFTWTFENFTEDNFFGGNYNQLIWTTLTQIEGVCQADDMGGIYISSEEFSNFLDPTLYFLDPPGSTTNIESPNQRKFKIYSDNSFLNIEPDSEESITADIQLLSISGTILFKKQFINEQQVQIPVPDSEGIVILVVKTEKGTKSYKVLL